MAEEFKQGIENVPDEALDVSKMGQIIDEDRSKNQVNWFVWSGVIVLVMILCAWIYVALSTTDEDRLIQQLATIQGVQELNTQIIEIIQQPRVDLPRLKWAIERSFDIANTELRGEAAATAPFIEEKYLAMVEILEALLRMDVEGFLDMNDPDDRQYFERNLIRLGDFKIEFYDQGVLQTLPLLADVSLRRDLKTYENKEQNSYDEKYLEELKQKIAKQEEQESFSIVAPSLLLGKWYRYRNQMEMSRRCFLIGTSYIEGYKTEGQRFDGRPPQQLNRLWEEYAECLESLAEDKFDSSSYREARSYLMRMYHVPQAPGFEIDSVADFELKDIANTIASLEQDKKIIKKAIQQPESLASFPLLSFDDPGIQWGTFWGICDRLGRKVKDEDQELTRTIWGQLDRDFQDEILKATGSGSVDLSLRKKMISYLNTMIENPLFFKKIKILKDSLSPLALHYYNQSQEEDLKYEEFTLLNRNILDLAFSGAFPDSFLLTGGRRLTNVLDLDQKRSLLDLYQKELDRTDTPASRRQELLFLMQEIYNQGLYPRYYHLHQALMNQRSYLTRKSALHEKTFDDYQKSLTSLKIELEELSSQNNIDFEKISEIKRKQELLMCAQQESKIQKDELDRDVAVIEAQLSKISLNLEKELASVEKELVYYNKKQELVRYQQREQQHPLLELLDRKIVLHQKMVSLLENLKKVKGDSKIQDLFQQQQLLEAKYSFYKNQLNMSKGDENEKVALELAKVEQEKNKVFQEFESLFAPLRNVVADLSKEEGRIQKTKTQLADVEKKIKAIVGQDGKKGSLSEKSQRRQELLLTPEKYITTQPTLSSDIEHLNEEILKEQRELAVLLKQKENYTQTLALFYPTKDESYVQHLTQLMKELDEQKQSYDEYKILKAHKKLYDDLVLSQGVVVANLNQISDVLNQQQQPLEKKDSLILRRCLQEIVNAENQIRQDRRLLKNYLKNHSLVEQGVEQLLGQGIMLDAARWYELQQAMGIDLESYNALFDERDQILDKIEALLVEKSNLNQLKQEALKVGDKLKVEMLFPQFSENELAIQGLSEHLLASNQKLILLGKEFLNRRDKVVAYCRKLGPQIEEASKKMKDLQKNLDEKDRDLIQASHNVVGQTADVQEQMKQLCVEDLKNIDSLIEYQKNEVGRLKNYRQTKHKENYYKTKSLWLYGKSFFEQSKLNSYKELQQSSLISDELLDEEKRIGQQIVAEFEDDEIYTRDRFEGDSKVDNNEISLTAWIDYLEKSALKIFEKEMSKFSLEKYFLDDQEQMLPTNYQIDVNAFLARAKFVSGQIYLKRAIELKKRNAEGSAEVVKEELNQAYDAFLGFLDYVRPFLGLEKKAFLTEKEFASKEFPLRKRKTLQFIEEAKLHLGTICVLQKRYEEAIDVFQGILSDMSSGMINMKPPSPRSLNEVREEVKEDSIYASVLASYSLSHEVLFRLGFSYQALSDIAFQNYVKSSQHEKGETSRYTLKPHQVMALQAIYYYNKLIVTQTYSSWRKAALFQRGILWSHLGNYDQARVDLLSVLEGSSKADTLFPWEEMSLKGDLLQQLAPTYSYVSFELGKLYLNTGEYALATQAFLDAKDKTADPQELIKAKIAYAQALVQDASWVKALLLLEDLAKESTTADSEHKIFYTPEIWLDLAQVKSRLGKTEDALHLYAEILRFAPPDLVMDGEVNIKNKRGFELLQSDYRDVIRPLAQASYETANLLLQKKAFQKAAQHYEIAESLFKVLPWKYDRLLKEKTKPEFDRYQKECLLKARWGVLQKRVCEYQYTLTNSLRKKILQQTAPQTTQEIMLFLDEAFKSMQPSLDDGRDVLLAVQNFKDSLLKELPENQERKKILEARSRDQELGKQQWQIFTALTHCSDFIEREKQSMPLDLNKKILERFDRGSLEIKLLNEFAFEYLPYLSLNDTDRQQMLSSKGNFENFLFIPNFNQRVPKFSQDLQEWLQKRIAQTGLGDFDIPVSFESSLIQEVDLYIVSLLSTLDTQSDYDALQKIAKSYWEEQSKNPSRITRPDRVWEIFEFAMRAAQSREQWDLVTLFGEAILNPDRISYFIFDNDIDQKQASLSLATAYFYLAKDAKTKLSFVQQDEFKDQEAIVQKFKDNGQKLLNDLVNLDPNIASYGILRIRASQILQEFSNI